MLTFVVWCGHCPGFRPTRAEATDIANAILDGADGFLLGAETLRGLYPVETINVILHISKQAEKFFDETMHFDYLMQVLHWQYFCTLTYTSCTDDAYCSFSA